MKKSKDIENRFWSMVNKTEGCWNWLGSTCNDGYGRISTSKAGKYIYAHRFSFELKNGQIPSGMTIDHICRNRKCVNPDHLRVVSNRENILSGISPSAFHAKQTHCIHGHPFSGDNLIIRKSGGRDCKECKRNRQKMNLNNSAISGS